MGVGALFSALLFSSSALPETCLVLLVVSVQPAIIALMSANTLSRCLRLARSRKGWIRWLARRAWRDTIANAKQLLQMEM